MMILKLMLISMVALVILMGWVVVIATDRYIDKQIKNNHEDIPEILAGSEMHKEMVDAMVDKPKRGRPKKNG